jgi:hypothetical protein
MVWSRPGGQELQRATIDFTGDSIASTVTGAQAATAHAPRAPGAVPLPALPNSFFALAFFEQALRQAAPQSAPAFEIPWILPGGRQTFPTKARRLGGDTVEIGFFAGPMLARTDRAGRLLWLSGERTTTRIMVQRVADIDLAGLATAFAARDAAGHGLGSISPPDSASAAISGARLRIGYSRPSRRGRTIFGGVVPWNEVWRAGANAATTFTTDRDLDIGGAAVPAGSYTLYILPTPQRTELIINRQTGQWGTVYDASRDLVRIPLRAETLPEVVEQLTIAIAPAGNGATLSVAWDRTRYSVPVAVR